MRRSPATDLGLALLAFVAGLFVFGWLALAIRAPLAGWLIAPAALAGVAVVPGRRRAALATLVLAVSGALLFAAAFFDVSWDGQAYHQEAVLALARGWNPLWDAPLSILERPDNVWIDHYPKGAWIAQAILFRATGSLEAAKGLQLVAALAAGLLGFAALRERGVGPRWAALVAGLAACNPVTLVQAFSFYVDGLGLELVVAALALGSMASRGSGPDPFRARARTRAPARESADVPGSGLPSTSTSTSTSTKSDRRLLLGLGLALALLANLKFTGVVYGACFVAGGALIACWRGGRWRPFFATGTLALSLGTLVLGYDPYVTNTVRAGHPLHPVMGAQAIDFIGIQLDPAFHKQSRLRRFLVGVFARASNQNVAPATKLPFTITGSELDALAYADLRLGGFGPLWSGSLLAAALFLTAGRRLGLRVPPAAWAAGALLVGTVFLNPALWWARYVPQLWLLPLGALALAARTPLTGAGRAWRAGLALLLVTDASLVARAALAGQLRASAAVRDELASLAGSGPLEAHFGAFEANAERLRAARIPFRVVATLSCSHPRPLHASVAAVCPAPMAAQERR